MQAQELAVDEAILQSLRGSERVKAGDLIERVEQSSGAAESTIRNQLTRLKELGEITQPRYGYYQLRSGQSNGGGEDQPAPSAVASTGPPAPLGTSSGQLEASAQHAAGQLVYLPLSSVRARADGDPFEPEVPAYAAYDRAQLRREVGVDPARLAIVRIAGHSMEPTMRPGDRALVAQHAPGEVLEDGGVYLLRLRDRGVAARRAYWHAGGALTLESDNRERPRDFCFEEGQQGDWTVIGRVLRVEKAL